MTLATRVLTTLFLFAMAAPALAAPVIDQTGADALKPRIAEAIDGFAATLATSGITLTQAGDLMVEPAEGYYAITTPSLSMKMPGGTTRTVGMVAVNAIPTDNPDNFKVAIALPTPMMDTDATGATVGSLSIGQQTMNGLWNMKALAFTELQGNYKNLRVVNNARKTETVIPDLTATLKLTPSGALWSGPLDVVMTNPAYRNPSKRFTAGTLRNTTRFTDLDFEARKKLAADTKKDAATIDYTWPSLAAEYLTRLAKKADSTITFENATHESRSANGKQSSGTIRNGVLETSIDNNGPADANMVFDLKMTGMANDNPAMARMAATQILAKGTGSKVDLVTLLNTPANWNAQRDALARAGTALKLEKLTFDSVSMGVTATGELKAVENVPLGVTGNQKLTVRGMEELLAWISNPETTRGTSLQGMEGPLQAVAGLMMMTGVPAKDEQGRAVRVYDLVMTPDGRMVLNNADFSAMTQLLDAAQKPAATQPATTTASGQ